MIHSSPVTFMFRGGLAQMYVLRNNGHCWGRLVTSALREYDVNLRRDYYDEWVEVAAAAFIRAARRGHIEVPVGRWELGWTKTSEDEGQPS